MNINPPESNNPISEQYRIVAKEWVAADAAARLLEESKTSVLAQRIAAIGDMAHNKAENQVKASPEWRDYIAKMVTAKEQANMKRVQLEFIRMKFTEWNSAEASKRAEMKL